VGRPGHGIGHRVSSRARSARAAATAASAQQVDLLLDMQSGVRTRGAAKAGAEAHKAQLQARYEEKFRRLHKRTADVQESMAALRGDEGGEGVSKTVTSPARHVPAWAEKFPLSMSSCDTDTHKSYQQRAKQLRKQQRCEDASKAVQEQRAYGPLPRGAIPSQKSKLFRGTTVLYPFRIHRSIKWVQKGVGLPP